MPKQFLMPSDHHDLPHFILPSVPPDHLGSCRQLTNLRGRQESLLNLFHTLSPSIAYTVLHGVHA
ncbi:MAG: hypothetical protein J6I53_07145 [Treponema sp.]|nr:hypothetical protein [Treponema sp.]